MNRLISVTTRNNCVDRAIFTVGDLAKYVDVWGKVVIRGMSQRSLLELQKVWDQANALPSTTTNHSVPGKRKLVRVISKEEQDTIDELTELYQSAYLGGNTNTTDSSFIAIEALEHVDNQSEEDHLSNPETHDAEPIDNKSFAAHMIECLDFLQAKKIPRLGTPGKEGDAARFLEELRSGYYVLTEEQKTFAKEIFKMVEQMKTILKI